MKVTPPAEPFSLGPLFTERQDPIGAESKAPGGTLNSNSYRRAARGPWRHGRASSESVARIAEAPKANRQRELLEPDVHSNRNRGGRSLGGRTP